MPHDCGASSLENAGLIARAEQVEAHLLDELMTMIGYATVASGGCAACLRVGLHQAFKEWDVDQLAGYLTVTAIALHARTRR